MKIIDLNGVDKQIKILSSFFSAQTMLQPSFIIKAKNGGGGNSKIYLPKAVTVPVPASFTIFVEDNSTGIEVYSEAGDNIYGLAVGSPYIAAPGISGKIAKFECLSPVGGWNLTQAFASGGSSSGAPIPITFKTVASHNSYSATDVPNLALLSGGTIDSIRMAGGFVPSNLYNSSPVTLPLVFSDSLEIFDGDDVAIWYHQP